MLTKKKAKTTKPSKLPIPRRIQPAAEVEAVKSERTAKPAKRAKARAKPAKAAEAATPAPEAPTAPPPPAAKPKVAGKMFCLDVAAEVLQAAGTPMRCREMVDAMRAKGPWSSDAPTPHQTLASALLREVTKKGPAARFRKADRGRFQLNA